MLDENRLAWTGSQAFAAPPDSTGRCLLICGPAGCGKSHLCDVLMRERSARTGGRCERLCAADFREMHRGRALSADSADGETDDREIDDAGEPLTMASASWLNQLIHCDLVVVEEFHQLVRHQTEQRHFRTLFDVLRQYGTDLVVTSLQTPGDLKGLQAGVANRLRGGLCVSIKRPGPASRERLLEHFCSHLQIAVPRQALRLFARHLAVSPRELLGSLLRFEELAWQQRRMPDADLARAFLRLEVSPSQITVESVARAVAREFGVRLADMRSRLRDQVIAVPRQCAMYLARELTDEHLSTIGGYFSNRSHSTVLHACSRIVGRIDRDPALRQRVAAVRRVLNAPQ